jgi:hypothetical protein
MSNPVTNVEIEDVLSSIRRLVSDEARPARSVAEPKEQFSQTAKPDDQRKPAEAPALVLTPALRVLDGALVEPEPLRFEDDAETAEAGDDASAKEMTSEAATLLLTEDLVAQGIECNAPSDITADAIEPAEDVQATDQLPSFLTHRSANEDIPARNQTSQAEHVDGSEGETAEIAQDAVEASAPDAALDAASETQIQDMIQGEAYAARADDTEASSAVQAETALSDQEASAEAQTLPEDVHTESDSLEGDHVADSHPAETAVSEPQPETYEETAEQADEAQTELTIEAKIAALEALIGTADSQFEPDGSSGASSAMNESLPWQDSDVERSTAGLRSVPDPAEDSQAAEFHSEFDAFEQARQRAIAEAADELQADVADTLLEAQDAVPVLDEEALRDMVADIVRQELHGPLGERITRNVRKLVRREIYRAMAANELD